ncbi:c-type cytochrome [Peristeroidobacter agariperforans]|uniref:c-type cytochrome n=1 Tax=Peristeroidobacter agariperforans TaxID=268404 RepID=UPI00101CD9E9|nr:cytochrome c [Peristeroidobacter agariperforans]
MSKQHSPWILVGLLLAIAVVAEDLGSTRSDGNATLYGVGEPLSPEQVTSVDISVLPTGAGLPDGKGSAREGATVYATHCAACHGDNGEGRGDYVALVGGRGSLASSQPVLTVGSYWPTATTVFDYIRRAMPYNTPGILTADEVYALTAWILEKNAILQPGVVLDRRGLSAVRMPNSDGFIRDPRPDVTPQAHVCAYHSDAQHAAVILSNVPCGADRRADRVDSVGAAKRNH